MSEPILFTPREIDVMLRYPAGRTARLARQGKISSIVLPDGEIRITQETVRALLIPAERPEVQEVAHVG